MDYTIAEYYHLPSDGKIYEKEVNPNVGLKSMTCAHEMLRTSKTDYAYRTLCEIIDDCILEDIGISSYDLCMGDYEYLLHKLRIVTYGPEYKLINTCPICSGINENTIMLDQLQELTDIDKAEELREFELPVSKKRIRLKYQTPRLADTAIINNIDNKKKNKQDKLLVYMLMELIESIDGARPNKLDLQKWLEELPMKDTLTLTSHIDEMNKCIGLDNELEVECEVCGIDFATTFRKTSEFFRPTTIA